MFSTFDQAKTYVQQNAFQVIDLKFSDLWGRWHHISIPASQFNEQLMRDGVGFDGSSVGLSPSRPATWCSCRTFRRRSAIHSGMHRR